MAPCVARLPAWLPYSGDIISREANMWCEFMDLTLRGATGKVLFIFFGVAMGRAYFYAFDGFLRVVRSRTSVLGACH